MVSEHETKTERLDKTSLLEFIDQGINKNTRTKTERDARRFLDYLKSRGETRPVTQFTSSDLDFYVGTFFMQLTKQNGDPYEPSTITSIHR